MKRSLERESKSLKRKKVVPPPIVEPIFDMELIPVELWALVLEFLNIRDKLKMRLVSRLWCSLVAEHTKSITVNHRTSISKAIVMFPKVQHIWFVNRDFDSKELVPLQNLRRIRFDNLDFEPKHVKDIPNLEEIVWRTTEKVHKHCLVNTFKLLVDRPTFTRLTLINKYSYCVNCQSYYAKLNSLQELRVINGSGFDFSWLRTISTLPNLLKLDLLGTEMPNFAIEKCKELVFPNLKILKIARGDWKITEAEMEIFIKHITDRGITIELY